MIFLIIWIILALCCWSLVKVASDYDDEMGYDNQKDEEEK